MVSCSLFNSWNTLKTEGQYIFPNHKINKKKFSLLPGFYNAGTLNDEQNSNFRYYDFLATTETNTPVRVRNTFKPYIKILIINPVLQEFLGIETLLFYAFVKELNYSKEYYIRCDLIAKQKNLFMVKPSEVLDRKILQDGDA